MHLGLQGQNHKVVFTGGQISARVKAGTAAISPHQKFEKVLWNRVFTGGNFAFLAEMISQSDGCSVADVEVKIQPSLQECFDGVYVVGGKNCDIDAFGDLVLIGIEEDVILFWLAIMDYDRSGDVITQSLILRAEEHNEHAQRVGPK